MGNKQQRTLSLDAFKDLVKEDKEFKRSFKRNDFIDYANGIGTIYRENLMSELEKFECKNEEELLDSLWYTHGVFAKVVD